MSIRRHGIRLIGSVLCAVVPADLRAAIAPYYERVHQLNLVMSAADEAAARLPLPVDQSSPQPGTPTDYRVALGDVHCD